MCDTEGIERAFKNLHAPYILQGVSTLRLRIVAPPPLQATATDSSAQCKAIDDAVSSFYRNPFNLSHTANVSVETLFKLNQNREVAEEVTKAMRAQGALWAENSDSSDRVEGLSQIQTRLMERLWAICIPQMESEGLDFARTMGDERLDLKELNLGLKSAIARGKSQKFSIAFCSMVKAG